MTWASGDGLGALGHKTHSGWFEKMDHTDVACVTVKLILVRCKQVMQISLWKACTKAAGGCKFIRLYSFVNALNPRQGAL